MDIQEASTQELVNALFEREDWREAETPEGVSVDRGKKMKMNAKDERGEDNYVRPMIRMDKMPLGVILQNASEAFWRTHVNAFRQEDNVELAHKHRDEHTIGWRDAEVNEEHQEIPEVEVYADDAGNIDSQEEKMLDAKQKIRQLANELGISMEEAAQRVLE